MKFWKKEQGRRTVQVAPDFRTASSIWRCQARSATGLDARAPTRTFGATREERVTDLTTNGTGRPRQECSALARVAEIIADPRWARAIPAVDTKRDPLTTGHGVYVHVGAARSAKE